MATKAELGIGDTVFCTQTVGKFESLKGRFGNIAQLYEGGALVDYGDKNVTIGYESLKLYLKAGDERFKM